MNEQNKGQPMRTQRLREEKTDEIHDNILYQIKDIFEDRRGDICKALMPDDYAEELSKVHLHDGSSSDGYVSLNSGLVSLRMLIYYDDLYASSRKPDFLEKWLHEIAMREEKQFLEDYCKKRKLKANNCGELSDEDYMDFEEKLDRIFEDFEVEVNVAVSFSDLKENGSYECQIESWFEFQSSRVTYKSKTLDIPFAEIETENGREAILDKIEKYILSVCDL